MCCATEPAPNIPTVMSKYRCTPHAKLGIGALPMSTLMYLPFQEKKRSTRKKTEAGNIHVSRKAGVIHARARMRCVWRTCVYRCLRCVPFTSSDHPICPLWTLSHLMEPINRTTLRRSVASLAFVSVCHPRKTITSGASGPVAGGLQCGGGVGLAGPAARRIQVRLRRPPAFRNACQSISWV